MTILDAIEDESRSTRGRRINGIVVAIVTDNNDPIQLGRVKVTFRWLSDDNETDWIRIATLYAGPDRGSLFIPEVEDEVLVAFEHGDINRPFVIGAIWNEEGKPPTPETDNTLKKIKTKCGHQVNFFDKDGQEKIEVLSKSGHQMILDDSSGGEKITIKDKTGSNSIEIDSNQNSMKITSQLKLEIKSTQIDISADANMTLKAGGILTIQGSIVKIN